MSGRSSVERELRHSPTRIHDDHSLDIHVLKIADAWLAWCLDEGHHKQSESDT